MRLLTEQDEIVIKFGEQSAGFLISYIVSLLGAGVAMVMFLKSGPSRIVMEGWSTSSIKPLVFSFAAVFSTLVGKMNFLKSMMPDSSGWSTAERAVVWATFLLLPQFILSLFALYRAVGCRRLLPTIAQFPAFLATPLLTSLTFGPHTEYGYVSFSPKFTIVNSVMTTVMATVLAFVCGYFYTVSYVYLTVSLAALVLAQFTTLTLALAVQFPNSEIAKFLQFDAAALNVVSGESDYVFTN